MKSRIVFGGALLAGLCASASVPTVSNVTTTQDAMRKVTVNYTLSGEAGIVTLTAQTNRGDDVWVDVDDVNLTSVAGDVNKLVEPGNRSLTWRPHKSWPDQFITGGKIRIGVKAWSKIEPPDYMVVSLTVPKTVRYYASAGAVPFGVTDDRYKTDYLIMRKIPAANVEWRMGSPETENGRDTDGRETSRVVTLADDYYIGVYEVTQRQYELVAGDADKAYFKLAAYRATRPMEGVTFNDIRGKAGDGYDWPKDGHKVLSTSFMGVLREFSGLDGFDLPTHAQWEFACRAGCGSAFYNGTELEVDRNSAVSTNVNPLARYRGNGGYVNGKMADANCTVEYGTAKVGSYEPNAWGLYDMVGNVSEQCLDWHTMTPCDFGTDGPLSGSDTRQQVGGNWSITPANCRSATVKSHSKVNASSNYVGLRICCSLNE